MAYETLPSWPKPGSHLNPNIIPMSSHHGVFLLKVQAESADLGVCYSQSVNKHSTISCASPPSLSVRGEQRCLCLGQHQLYTFVRARRNVHSHTCLKNKTKKLYKLEMHIHCKKIFKRISKKIINAPYSHHSAITPINILGHLFQIIFWTFIYLYTWVGHKNFIFSKAIYYTSCFILLLKTIAISNICSVEHISKYI